MTNLDILRRFYEIIGECGMIRPPWEVWREHATDNAEVWPIARGGEMVGGILFKGHTIHIAVLPEWHGRWMTKTILRAWRESYTHDCDLYATPMTANKAACQLAERLGFRKEGPAGQSTIYVKDKRVETCRQ